MAVQHEDIVDPYIHEPKGIAAATTGQVYVADGAGGGAWSASESGINTGGNGQQYRSNGSGGGSWVSSGDFSSVTLGAATDNATATTLTAQDTWYPVAGTWVVGPEDTMVGATTGLLTCTTAGTYQIEASLSIIASTSSDTFNFSVLVDGAYVAATARIRRKIGTGGDVGALSVHATLTVTAGQTVGLGIAALTAEGADAPPAGTTCTVENASLSATLLISS